MPLTRIDCQFYCSRSPQLANSSYVAFNPSLKPGSLVVSGATAPRSGIGSQIACKLALEHFIEGSLDYFGTDAKTAPEDMSQSALETAFKRANSSVYNFGHKLAAGGRMSATLLGLIVAHDVIAAGKVGPWSAYLYRNEQLFPFFAAKQETSPEQAAYVGEHSLVRVETASVVVQEHDVVFGFSALLERPQELYLAGLVRNLDFNNPASFRELVRKLFKSAGGELEFAMCSRIGPDAIYLQAAV